MNETFLFKMRCMKKIILIQIYMIRNDYTPLEDLLYNI